MSGIFLRALVTCRHITWPTDPVNSDPPRLVPSLPSGSCPQSSSPDEMTAATRHPQAQAKHPGNIPASPLSLHPMSSQQTSPGKSSSIALNFPLFSIHASPASFIPRLNDCNRGIYTLLLLLFFVFISHPHQRDCFMPVLSTIFCISMVASPDLLNDFFNLPVSTFTLCSVKFYFMHLPLQYHTEVFHALKTSLCSSIQPSLPRPFTPG